MHTAVFKMGNQQGPAAHRRDPAQCKVGPELRGLGEHGRMCVCG